MELEVKLKNLTEAQAIALEDMFATWVELGNVGCSRWTSFYADGDGNFRPKVEVNGEEAKCAPDNIISKEERGSVLWKDKEYKIDFDFVSYKLVLLKELADSNLAVSSSIPQSFDGYGVGVLADTCVPETLPEYKTIQPYICPATNKLCDDEACDRPDNCNMGSLNDLVSPLSSGEENLWHEAATILHKEYAECLTDDNKDESDIYGWFMQDVTVKDVIDLFKQHFTLLKK